MSPLLELLATLATGLFTGAAVYVSLVEHPARVSCGPAVAITEFRPSYKRAAVLQGILALVGAVAAVARWGIGGPPAWLIGGLLLGGVIPFTLLVILPTNKRLLDVSFDPNSPESVALLGRWGWLHAVRSAASLLAFLTFLSLLAGG